MEKIKQLIWIYLYLLIIEGALRKWVLPSLATPLLIVRDPIAIYAIYLSVKYFNFKFNFWVQATFIITLIAVITTLIFGHGNLIVAIYGARIFLIQFPMIFIIGYFLNANDVSKMGNHLLVISILMGILVLFQFYSPQTAWVNKGVGGEAGVGFRGALDFYRPPGTFSFTNGLVSFFSLIFPFVLWNWNNSFKTIPKSILIIATLISLLVVPFSISRSLFFQGILTLTFFIIINLKSTKKVFQIVLLLVIGSFCLYFLQQFDFISKSTEVFTSRFETANKSEGGLEGVFLDRFLGGLFGAIVNDDNASFWGKGIGMGTNAGAKLLTGNAIFLISEGEWGRLIGEFGFIFGLSLIFIRLSIGLSLLKNAWLFRRQNSLPFLLSSATFFNLIQGQWAQPTSLGFAVLGTGLVIASLKPSNVIESTPN